jgi:hypothetical protein
LAARQPLEQAKGTDGECGDAVADADDELDVVDGIIFFSSTA